MKITNPVIKKLLTHYKELSLIYRIKAVLDWDLNVNLPEKAAEGRALQSEYLTKQVTKLWLDPEFRRTLEKASTIKTLNLEEKAIVRNLNEAGKYYFNVPQEIIARKEKVASKSFMAWKQAKEKNEFHTFLPLLKELISLEQIVAKHIGYKENIYDALLNLHEPGLTAAECKKVFDQIKPSLIALVKKIQKSKKYVEKQELVESNHHYPIPEQEKLGKFIMQKMGFDFSSGRVDVSPHPFTIELDRSDIRITASYQKNDFRSSYTAYAHEAGHALYEQGVNPEYSQTPLEGGVSFGIHEALSRFWENMVGRNPSFLHFLTPIFQSFYPDQLAKLTEEDIIKLFHVVKPSFIRIEADEVTYTLHIILRFEMENGLLNGEIKPENAAQIWKEKFKEYFGIVPPTDSAGILQDVHWSYGEFGYFPSYAMGNLYGAQLLAAMKKDINVDEELKSGNLSKIHVWLKDMVHQHGSLYLPKDLIKKATGESLNPKYFINYLTEKYNKIY
jgi:carboxypeptidase Taq